MPNQPREGTSAVTFSMDDALLERAEYLAEKLCEEHPGLRFTRFDAIRATLARSLPIPPADWKPKRSSSEVRHQATATLTTRAPSSSASPVTTTIVSSSLASYAPTSRSPRSATSSAASSAQSAPPSSKRGRKAAEPVVVPSAQPAPPSSKRGRKAAEPVVVPSAQPAPPSSKRGRKAAEPVEIPDEINSTLEVPVFSRSQSKPASKRPRR